MRIRPEADAQVSTVIDGRRYDRQRDGYFHMPDRDAKAHMQSGNLPAPPAAGPVRRRSGYRCVKCGFGSFFTTCGRHDCGGRCEREE